MLHRVLARGIVIAFLPFLFAPAHAVCQVPVLQETEHLVGSQPDLRFGWTLATSAGRLFSGAQDANRDHGSVFVFEHGPAGWFETARLLTSDGYEDGLWGVSVAADGDTLVVGAEWHENDMGVVYVFEFDGTDWQETARIDTPGTYYGFGRAVDIDGDRLVVGSHRSHAAYTYVRNGQDWVLERTLGGGGNSWFGYSVALEGNTLAVGAPWKSNPGVHRGAVYVFVHDGTDWTQQAVLETDPPVDYSELGDTVSLSGDTIVAGASWEEFLRGAAYVFERTGSSWTQVDRLEALNPTSYGSFGYAVVVENGDLFVDHRGDDTFGSDAGSVYWYQRSGGAWNHRAVLRSSPANLSHGLGRALAVQDGTLFAAAFSPGPTGGVFVFDPPCGMVETYCPAVANSTGKAAQAGALGHLSVAGNDLTLVASQCPPNLPSLFIYGPEASQVPFGDGFLCVRRSHDAPIFLYPAGPTSADGTVSRVLDLTILPPAGQILPGSTWHFQLVYRDPAAGGSTFNFSNGLRMTFCP